ncbi:MAG: hypothetical protein JXA66_04625, partial [Oligoflexia bacterium]|nr:hypothetical protein [Oligoflexia bacterium]
VMKRGGRINIKTDNNDYFMQIFEVVKSVAAGEKIRLVEFSRDYHSSEYAGSFGITAFERIFLRQKLMINYLACVVL